MARGVTADIQDTQGGICNCTYPSIFRLDEAGGTGKRCLRLGFGRCAIPARERQGFTQLAFYSEKYSLVERIYKIYDKEFMTMVRALVV